MINHPVKITSLNNYPQFAPILAHWAFTEWYRNRDIDFRILVKAYQTRAARKSLPYTLMALHGDLPVGMVTLKYSELISKKDCFPWLNALYVIPEFRGKQIGKMLIEALKYHAAEAGFKKLYLFIDYRKHEFLEKYYKSLGWKFFDSATDNDGNDTSIYMINI